MTADESVEDPIVIFSNCERQTATRAIVEPRAGSSKPALTQVESTLGEPRTRDGDMNRVVVDPVTPSRFWQIAEESPCPCIETYNHRPKPNDVDVTVSWS